MSTNLLSYASLAHNDKFASDLSLSLSFLRSQLQSGDSTRIDTTPIECAIGNFIYENKIRSMFRLSDYDRRRAIEMGVFDSTKTTPDVNQKSCDDLYRKIRDLLLSYIKFNEYDNRHGIIDINSIQSDNKDSLYKDSYDSMSLKIKGNPEYLSRIATYSSDFSNTTWNLSIRLAGDRYNRYFHIHLSGTTFCSHLQEYITHQVYANWLDLDIVYNLLKDELEKLNPTVGINVTAQSVINLINDEIYNKRHNARYIPAALFLDNSYLKSPLQDGTKLTGLDLVQMFSDTTTSYQIVHTLQVFKSIHACNLSNITITILCYIHHNDSTPIYRLMSNDLNYNDLIGVLNLNPRALKDL
jgi:hypothetical protein